MANHKPGWKGPESKRYRPPRKDECVNGHDLTEPGAVETTQRKRGGKTYPERRCVKCRQERARRWWRENRAQGRMES